MAFERRGLAVFLRTLSVRDGDRQLVIIGDGQVFFQIDPDEVAGSTFLDAGGIRAHYNSSQDAQAIRMFGPEGIDGSRIQIQGPSTTPVQDQAILITGLHRVQIESVNEHITFDAAQLFEVQAADLNAFLSDALFVEAAGDVYIEGGTEAWLESLVDVLVRGEQDAYLEADRDVLITADTGDVLIDSPGGVTIAPELVRETVRAYRSANQSIANNTSGVVWTFDSAEEETGVFDTVSSGVATLNESGLFLITAQATWAGNGTGRREMQVVHEGNQIIRSDDTPGGITATRGHGGSVVHRMVAGDELEVRVFQNSGGALNLLGGTWEGNTSRLSVTLLGR